MKVLFFTKYSRAGASSRLRSFQYFPFLESKGIECVVNPLFGAEYLKEVYGKTRKHNKWLAAKGFIKRIGFILKAGRYDKVVIEKELFPYFPAFFEWTFKIRGIEYIADYDDAIFHNYDVSTNPIHRLLFSKKIEKVVRYAKTVVVGNEYLQEKATEFGASSIVLIPTVVDTEKYLVKAKRPTDKFTVGWIGSPVTFKYLAFLKPVFQNLSRRYDFNIVYIGANKTLGLANEHIKKWTEETEIDSIQQFDVGIMPLEDNIWERGKCGYKLIQYMACGKPVIGTPIGVNKKIIVEGRNGFQATIHEEWEAALVTLLEGGPAKCAELGRNGRQQVENEYSLKVSREVWLKLLST